VVGLIFKADMLYISLLMALEVIRPKTASKAIFFKGTDSFGAFFFLKNDVKTTKNQTPTKDCRPLC